SAGQRCSALRMLYLQDDVADGILEMLRGAMDALRLGDPWDLSTDVGPVIDREAQTDLLAYCDRMAAEGRLVHRLDAPETGLFVPPALFRVSGIEALEREVFGPILHVATYRADTIDAVIEAINAKGYGLTFGLHTRIDDRVQHVVDRIEAGNIYVNRNQIGAIVGSQPFGGEGLSGTGPKAGGPFYVRRFARPKPNGKVTGGSDRRIYEGRLLSRADLQAAVDSVSTGPRAAGSGIAHRTATVAGRLGIGMEPDLDRLVEARRSGIELPGPTGESNRLWLYPRGVILCVGDDPDRVLESALSALYLGNAVVALLPMADRVATAQGMIGEAGLAARFLDGRAEADEIAAVSGLAGVFAQYEDTALARLRQALAAGDGPILQPVVPGDAPIRLMLERHVCVDTTAAGGNASLMTAAEA
ncbi:MAG: aldehyde dehydrogenase family protein, partial [Pseudomonadota bacterium]